MGKRWGWRTVKQLRTLCVILMESGFTHRLGLGEISERLFSCLTLKPYTGPFKCVEFCICCIWRLLHSRCLVKAKLGTESEKNNFIITSHSFSPVLPAFQAEHVQVLLSSGLVQQSTFCIWRCSSGAWCFWMLTCTMVTPWGQDNPSVPFIPGRNAGCFPEPPASSCSLHPSVCSTPAAPATSQLFVPLLPETTLLFSAQSMSRNLRQNLLYELQVTEADLRCWDTFG